MDVECLCRILQFSDGPTISNLRIVFPCLFSKVLPHTKKLVGIRHARAKQRIKELDAKSDKIHQSISAIWAISSIIYVERQEDYTDEDFDNFESYVSELSAIDEAHTQDAKDLILTIKRALDSDLEMKVRPSAYDSKVCSCRRIVEGNAVRLRDLVYVLVMESAPARRADPAICCRRLRRTIKKFENAPDFVEFYKYYNLFFKRAYRFINNFLVMKNKFAYLDEQYRVIRFLSIFPLIGGG